MKNPKRLKGSLKVGVLKGTRGEVMDEDYFFSDVLCAIFTFN